MEDSTQWRAQFDVTTGKKTAEPKLESPQGMEPLSQSWQKYFQYVSKMTRLIKLASTLINLLFLLSVLRVLYVFFL